MVTDLKLPNGLGFSPDGKTFYVNSYGPEMFTRAYDVGKDGALSIPRVLFSYDRSMGRGGPDGLKADVAGNVWSTGPGGYPHHLAAGQAARPDQAAGSRRQPRLGRGRRQGSLFHRFDQHRSSATKVAGAPPLYKR